DFRFPPRLTAMIRMNTLTHALRLMKRFAYQILLIATTMLGVLLAYSIWKASPRTAQTYFESGQRYYYDKKYPAAVIQFLNALQKDARNREARYLLALTYVKQNDATRAVAELKSLLEYYPNDTAAGLRLGSIYLA